MSKPLASAAPPEPEQLVAPLHSGAQWLVAALEAHGVEVVFGYPGGAIMPLYDALTGSRLRHILTRHEQAAALAADGYARVSGRAGVCIATSGPGATNLVTGLANAFLDSVPLVAITGQVSTAVMGTDAFQEVDIFGITLPVVKHSYLVRDASQLPAIVREAFEIAEGGRPGPVLIDLPKDVATAPISLSAAAPERRTPDWPQAIDRHAVAAANRLLAGARRPLLYAGGGIGIADAMAPFRRLVDRCGAPVVTTLKGLGTVATDHPACLGMLGMHGHPAANRAVQACDLLVCIGARFDDRATGRLDTFAPHARVIHLDVDPAEVSKLRTADVALIGDLAAHLDALGTTGDIDGWRQACVADRDASAPYYDPPGEWIYAPALLKQLAEQAGDALILTCDVGQHQMWVAQHCRITNPRRHLSSGGLGTMGYGLPAAIGAALADPAATVVVVSGDGSIMMNIQELATLMRYGIAVRIVLLDNASLGMVRQWQELFFDGNLSEVDLSDNPDFAAVAASFGLEAFAIRHRDEVAAGIQRLLAADGPCLMHVHIDPRANVWPLVPPGQSNQQMMMGDER